VATDPQEKGRGCHPVPPNPPLKRDFCSLHEIYSIYYNCTIFAFACIYRVGQKVNPILVTLMMVLITLNMQRKTVVLVMF